MPLYEYRCEGCGEVFELIQKFADEPLTVHDKCGGRVHRLISAAAIRFKGSGWYATDYANAGNGSKQRDSETKSDSERKSDSEKKSDSGKKADSDQKGSSDAAKTESKPSESKSAASDKPKSD
jgi:putative FmdB family regulatory protein